MINIIKNIRELKLDNVIDGGSCSKIYNFDNNLLFKLFNVDYRNLSLNVNKEFFDTLVYLSEIDNLKNIITPIDIYRSKSRLYGYSMTKVNGNLFDYVKDNILIKDLISSFNKLQEDIKVISDNYVKTEDIGGDNILYNGDMYLIDLDLSMIDYNYDRDQLFISTSYKVFYSLLLKIFGRISRDSILYNDLIKYKQGDCVDYSLFVNNLVDYYSNVANFQISSVNDIKKVYLKTL